MTKAAAETAKAAGLPLVTVLLPFALGFFLSNYYRNMNAVLSPHLVAELHLSASQLGLLISVYFLLSALFQAPLGLLMDRYGPRRVQGSLMLLSGIGTLIFALGHSALILLLGRALMGIGAAGSLMTAFLAVTYWFPSSRWPFFNGCIASFGGLGGLTATLPTEAVLQWLDWRQLMLVVALATFAGAALVLFAVPEKPGTARRTSFREQVEGVAQVYRDRLFWRIAPMYMTTVGGNLAFQGLWAGPWLRDVGHLLPGEIAGDLLVVSLLQTMSYVVLGALASALGRHGIGLMRIVATGAGCFIASQTGLLLATGDARWGVLLGMGCLANVNQLCYPMLSRHFPPALVGRGNTALNLFVFLGAFTMQYAVGVLIDLFPADIPGAYPIAAYRFAFAIIWGIQFLAWLWLLLPRRSGPIMAGQDGSKG